MSLRPVRRLIEAKPTLEGAGVRLRRAFGFGNTSEFDPFLLLDDFRNDVPDDYLDGFPWHPHRGIETITYVLAGTVEHTDSLGNRGAIGASEGIRTLDTHVGNVMLYQAELRSLPNRLVEITEIPPGCKSCFEENDRAELAWISTKNSSPNLTSCRNEQKAQ